MFGGKMSIDPGIWNSWIIQIGGTFSKSVIWTDGNDNPINLTGITGKMQIRQAADSPNPIASITISIPMPLTGEIDMLLTSAQTAALPPGNFVYDLQLSGSEVDYLIQGTIKVQQMVTT